MANARCFYTTMKPVATPKAIVNQRSKFITSFGKPFRRNTQNYLEVPQNSEYVEKTTMNMTARSQNPWGSKGLYETRRNFQGFKYYSQRQSKQLACRTESQNERSETQLEKDRPKLLD